MSTPTPAQPRASGLNTVIDTAIAPTTAFDRLREVPTWGWALLVTVALVLVGYLLALPANLHALDAALPAKLASSPQYASMSPDKQRDAIATVLRISEFVTKFLTPIVIVAVILLVVLVQSLILLIGNKIGHGSGTFRRYFALSMNVAVVGVGLTWLVIGIIAVIRGPNAYETTSAVQTSAPGLAMLFPGVRGALGGILESLTVFSLWATALLAIGMRRIGGVSAVASWTTAIVNLLIGVGFGALGGALGG